MSWSTLDDARYLWADAPLDPIVLQELLNAANAQCAAYAPALVDANGNPVPPPINYKHAEIRQARALWAVISGNADNQVGPDGMTVPVFPLDWHVKQLLRPRRGVPKLR